MPPFSESVPAFARLAEAQVRTLRMARADARAAPEAEADEGPCWAKVRARACAPRLGSA
jgi:hypothetical protein